MQEAARFNGLHFLFFYPGGVQPASSFQQLPAGLQSSPQVSTSWAEKCGSQKVGIPHFWIPEPPWRLHRGWCLEPPRKLDTRGVSTRRRTGIQRWTLAMSRTCTAWHSHELQKSMCIQTCNSWQTNMCTITKGPVSTKLTRIFQNKHK